MVTKTKLEIAWDEDNHKLRMTSKYLPLNLHWGEQTKIEYYLKWRQPALEDDLKLLKMEYLSNRWSNLTQIVNLILEWRRHQMKDDFQRLKLNNISKGKFIGNPRGNLECGSAQPSLFIFIIEISLNIYKGTTKYISFNWKFPFYTYWPQIQMLSVLG